MEPVCDRVEALLRGLDLPFERIEHPAAATADEAAAARGTALEIGGKAIAMKVDKRGFCILAVRGSDAIDNRAFRTHLGARRYRFATTDELQALTGLAPGCIPPFGRPIFDLPLFVDRALADNARIAFTPGLHTRSIAMATADWLAAAKPREIFAFSRAS